MAQILVVDDIALDRELAIEILSQDPALTIAAVASGTAALERIKESEPDLVVTDLVMPEMDGLVFVGRLHEAHPHVPAIIMTSQGSESIAVKALLAGAASYVPKAALATDLVENVKRVLAVSQLQRNQAQLMETMETSESSFTLSSDKLVPALIKHLQSCVSLMGLCDEGCVVQIGVALQEALTNAIHHGNLEVDSTLREEDMGAYENKIKDRGKEPPYCDRCVHVTASLSPTEARFVIRDEGCGFDPASLPDPRDPENLYRASGRGVLLMRTFMDEVTFNEIGNCVTMVKRR